MRVSAACQSFPPRLLAWPSVDVSALCEDVTFSNLQAVAVFVATISLFLFLIALYRPATGKCCSACSLGVGSGTLMYGYALAHILGLVAVIIIKETEEDFGGERGAWYTCEYAAAIDCNSVLCTQEKSRQVARSCCWRRHLIAMNLEPLYRPLTCVDCVLKFSRYNVIDLSCTAMLQYSRAYIRTPTYAEKSCSRHVQNV